MKKKKYGKFIEPAVNIALIGATSGIIAGSGAAGTTKTILNTIPALESVGVLKKTSKNFL